jgi:outer membrane protein
MRTLLLCTSMMAVIVTAPASFAQPPAAAAAGTGQQALRLTVDEAVKMAIERNLDLAAARLEPEIRDALVAQASGAFKPVVGTSLQRDSQRQPPSSFLIPVPTRNSFLTWNVGVVQRLPWFGTAFSVAWNGVRTSSNSFLNSYNPLLQSGLAVNVSQPLVRDLAIDSARLQVGLARIDRTVAGTALRESLVRTVANVKRAYWNLVTAIDTVSARKSSLALAEELERVNKRKVDVGQSPPLDFVSARAEVAANQERLIVAETKVKQSEDELRGLIFDASDRSVWAVALEPVDSPPRQPAAAELEQAVTKALGDRTDLARARSGIESSSLAVKYADNQRLPDVRLNAGYLAGGLGGTQVLRTDGFPGSIIGPGDVTGFGSVLNQVFAGRYPTWSVGVSVNYPVGMSAEQASFARARLEKTQAATRLKSGEAQVIREVRDAWRQIDMNARRIDTARAQRELAEQRMDAEQRRYEAGMSTSFLVIQAQRDLAEARTNELGAVLAYDLAVVDFEAVQQASPNPAPLGPPAAVGAASPNAVTTRPITLIGGTPGG